MTYCAISVCVQRLVEAARTGRTWWAKRRWSYGWIIWMNAPFNTARQRPEPCTQNPKFSAFPPAYSNGMLNMVLSENGVLRPISTLLGEIMIDQWMHHINITFLHVSTASTPQLDPLTSLDYIVTYNHYIYTPRYLARSCKSKGFIQTSLISLCFVGKMSYFVKHIGLQDLSGMGMMPDRRFFRILGRVSKTNEWLRPQLLGRVVIFNAPSWVGLAFRLASNFLSQKTLSKVWIHRQRCLGREWKTMEDNGRWASRRFWWWRAYVVMV